MKTFGQDASKNGQRSKKMYEVLVSHEAEKYYKKQDKDTKRRINKCIDILSKVAVSGIAILLLNQFSCVFYLFTKRPINGIIEKNEEALKCLQMPNKY